MSGTPGGRSGNLRGCFESALRMQLLNRSHGGVSFLNTLLPWLVVKDRKVHQGCSGKPLGEQHISDSSSQKHRVVQRGPTSP